MPTLCFYILLEAGHRAETADAKLPAFPQRVPEGINQHEMLHVENHLSLSCLAVNKLLCLYEPLPFNRCRARQRIIHALLGSLLVCILLTCWLQCGSKALSQA